MFSIKPAVFICFGQAGYIFRKHMEASLDQYLAGRPVLRQCFSFISIGEISSADPAWEDHLPVSVSEVEQRGYTERIRSVFLEELAHQLASRHKRAFVGLDVSYWKMQKVEISKVYRLIFIGSASDQLGGTFMRFCACHTLYRFSKYEQESLQLEFAYFLPTMIDQHDLSRLEIQAANARAYATLWELETDLQHTSSKIFPVYACWLFGLETQGTSKPASFSAYCEVVAKGFSMLLLFLPEEELLQRIARRQRLDDSFLYSAFGVQSFSWHAEDFSKWIGKKALNGLLDLDQFPNSAAEQQYIKKVAIQVLQEIDGRLSDQMQGMYPKPDLVFPSTAKLGELSSFETLFTPLTQHFAKDSKLGFIKNKGERLFAESYQGFADQGKKLLLDSNFGLNALREVFRIILKDDDNKLFIPDLANRKQKTEKIALESLSMAEMEAARQEMEHTFPGFKHYLQEKQKEERRPWLSFWKRLTSPAFRNRRKANAQKGQSFEKAYENWKKAFKETVKQCEKRFLASVRASAYELWIVEIKRLQEILSKLSAAQTAGGTQERDTQNWVQSHIFISLSDLEDFNRLLLKEAERKPEIDPDDLFQKNGGNWEELLAEKLAFLGDRLERQSLADLEQTGFVPPNYLNRRMSLLLRETHLLLAVDLFDLPDVWIVGSPSDVRCARALIGHSLQENILSAVGGQMHNEIHLFKHYEKVNANHLLHQSIWRTDYRRLSLSAKLQLHAPDFDPVNNDVPYIFSEETAIPESPGRRLFVKGVFSGKLSRETISDMFFYRPKAEASPVYLAAQREMAIRLLNIPYVHSRFTQIIETWFWEHRDQLEKKRAAFMEQTERYWELEDSLLLNQIISDFRSRSRAA